MCTKSASGNSAATVSVGIHETKGCCEDGIKAAARQAANHAFGIGALGYALQIGSVDLIPKLFFNILAALVMCVCPAAITNRPDIDKGHVKFAFFGLGNLKRAGLCG